MTAPVFFADDLNSGLSTIAEGDHVHLGGAEGKHAATVRRMQVGDELDLVNGEGSVSYTHLTLPTILLV